MNKKVVITHFDLHARDATPVITCVFSRHVKVDCLGGWLGFVDGMQHTVEGGSSFASPSCGTFPSPTSSPYHFPQHLYLSCMYLWFPTHPTTNHLHFISHASLAHMIPNILSTLCHLQLDSSPFCRLMHWALYEASFLHVMSLFTLALITLAKYGSASFPRLRSMQVWW